MHNKLKIILRAGKIANLLSFKKEIEREKNFKTSFNIEL